MDKNYVSALSTFGNVVHINKSTWGGDTELTPEDLGLIETPKNFKLGRMYLIQKEEHSKFTILQSEARRSLINLSFRYVFPRSRFVPNTTFPLFKREMEVIRTKFSGAVNDFKRDYLKNKLLMRQTFVEVSFKAYEQSGKKEDKNTFVNNFLERVEKLYPKVNEIDTKFKLSYTVYKVESPIMDEKSLQDYFEKDLSSKVERAIEGMVYEIRERIRLPFHRVATQLDEGKRLKKLSISALKRSIKSFEIINPMVNDLVTQQSLNRFKAEILSKSLSRLQDDIELREDFRIRLGDILKIVSHPKSHEIAIQELKSRILRGNTNAQP